MENKKMENDLKKKQTYDDLRFRIISHKFAPGELLNEKVLINNYGIGRTPLRDVLIELQRDGLIQRFPRSATIVAPMDLHLFKEVIEIRMVLEGFTAELAAERATKGDLLKLHEILEKVNDEKSNSENDLDKLTKYEFEFHDTLYSASQNRKLKELLRELHGISARFWYFWVFSYRELLDGFDEHREILKVLESRDGESAKVAMRKHIQNFVNKVKDKILK